MAPTCGSLARPIRPRATRFAARSSWQPKHAREQRRTMSRVIRTVIGLAMVAGGLLFAFWALYDLVQFGSCASGGPYVSARPCPQARARRLPAWSGRSLPSSSAPPSLPAAGCPGDLGPGLLRARGHLRARDARALGPEEPRPQWPHHGRRVRHDGLPALLMAMAGRSRAERRAVRIAGPTGVVEVRAPEDGGPAPIVSAAVPPNPDA